MTPTQVAALLRYENGRLYWLTGRRAGLEAGCRERATEVEATQAYNHAARQAFGEFARVLS